MARNLVRHFHVLQFHALQMPCKLVRQFHVLHFHVRHFQRPHGNHDLFRQRIDVIIICQVYCRLTKTIEQQTLQLHNTRRGRSRGVACRRRHQF